MSPPGFLIDENLSPDIAARLRQREPMISVAAIGQLGMPVKGTPDPQVLAWIEENEFLLVTNNRTSMPAHLEAHLAQGRHIPGILIAPYPAYIGPLVEDLLLVWGASLPDEYHDQITYLPTLR
jgi:hypothetical protein